MTASFPRFMDFPLGDRARIWEHTVEPPTVEARITLHDKPVSDAMIAKHNIELWDANQFKEYPFAAIKRLRSFTRVPATLHVCREARNHLTCTEKKHGGGELGSYCHRYRYRYRYRKAFQGVEDTRDFNLGMSSIMEQLLPPDDFWLELLGVVDLEPRYVWFNFEMDMLSIGQTFVNYLQYTLDYNYIKRLKFEREIHEEFVDGDIVDLGHMDNLQEVHVVCTDGLENWALVEDDVGGGRKKILVIDGRTSETATPADFAARWDLDKLRAALLRTYGAHIQPGTHEPFVPRLPPGWLEGEQFDGEYWYDNGEQDWNDENIDNWLNVQRRGLMNSGQWAVILKSAEISRLSG